VDLQHLIGTIPDYNVYLTVDEMKASTAVLARDFPDLVTVRPIGESRTGEPIELISIGEGRKNALVYAGAHANEAIGSMTAEFLSRHLCENDQLRQELGYAWYVIKCIDPDSMRLNEGWFQGPFTELHYHANYYRQPQGEQPEYMLPIHYKTLQFDQPPPEAAALQAAIDTVQPAFMWSLHNADFGGVYCSMSRPCEPLETGFSRIAESYGLPLDLGETSMMTQSYAPAVKRALSATDIYEAMLEAGVEDPAQEIPWRGMASGYAEDAYGTYYIVVEVPYWAFEAMGDTSPANVSRSQDVEQARVRSEAFADWLGSHLDAVRGDLRLNTPFHRQVDEALAYRRRRESGLRKLVHKDADADRPATRAEHFSTVYWQEHTRQRIRGMFMRMLDAEIAAGHDTDEMVSARDAVLAEIQRVAARLDAELDYSMVPIPTGVAFQTRVGLLAAKAVSA
jgi:hypothetical protein